MINYQGILSVVVGVGWLFMAGCETAEEPVVSGVVQPVPARGVMLGIDVLASNGYDLLRGKRVGLITNHTSVNGRGVKTRVVLQRAREVNLVALYAPEHGIEGKVGAGKKISGSRDAVTGLRVHSLYGATRKPTPGMLAGIDVLVFDLQDIGCRSYTYISTMAVAMEACGENRKEFVVLDRPNPLGGNRVEGPGLERKWTSFVGQVPVPYVHGMTAGELAMMIHGERWMKSRPKIGMVKMRGWSRGMVWRDTRLRWVATSPNIPKSDSPAYYVATGILGGLSGLDIGIGTSGPFEYAGSKGVDGGDLARAMRARGFRGVGFAPYRNAAKPDFTGVKITIDPKTRDNLVALDIALLVEIYRQTGGSIMRRAPASKMNLFHKVYGSEGLARDLRRGVDPGVIAKRWEAGNATFRRKRSSYLQYR